jgi:hypothetical protein
MPFAGAGDLRDDLLRLVRVDCDEVRTGHRSSRRSSRRTSCRMPCTSQRLAIHRHRLAGQHAGLLQPLPQCLFEGGDIERLEEPVQRRHTRRPARR